jgi:hypothetical protein
MRLYVCPQLWEVFEMSKWQCKKKPVLVFLQVEIEERREE